MARLMSLTSGGVTPVDFLTSYLKKNVGSRVVVTGHSLGACQTTTVSLWLDGILNRRLGPAVQVSAFPFAPSTAGNSAFATRWNSRLAKQSFLYLNNMDVVPYGFWNISATKTLWAPQITLPLSVCFSIDALALTLSVGGQGYTQPMPQRWLKSTVQAGAPTWTSQLITQHFPPMYYKLICAQYVQNGPKDVFDYPFVGTGNTTTFANCSVALSIKRVK
jgi:hypothetical protein